LGVDGTVWTTQVAHRDDFGTLRGKLPQCGKSRVDAPIIGNRGAIERHVEVETNSGDLTVQVAEALECAQ
jgi:hypothetical protein